MPNGGGTTAGQSGNKDSVKSQEQVAALIGDKYVITISVDSSYRDSSGEYVEDSVTYSTLSDGVYSYWGTSLEDLSNGSLYKRLSDDSLASYSYDREAGGYTSMTIFPTEINPFRSVNAIFLVEPEIEYTSKSSVTFLGRACTKYDYQESESNVAASATYERHWIMDNATGACLKYNAAVTGSSIGYGSAGASANFEVTKFELGEAVDQYITRISQKILIKEWDVDILEKLGLSESGNNHLDIYDIASGANIDSSKLQLREAENDVYADTGNGTYSNTYFVLVSQTAGESLVQALITNMFNCGAKYNDEGELQSSALAEPLCYIDRDGGLSYSFLASPGAGDYYISISAEWNPYINNGVWSISLTVYYHN